MMRAFFAMLIGWCLSGCVFSDPYKEPFINPLERSFGEPSDFDPLKIGDTPTLYLNQTTPTLVEGDPSIPKTPKMPPRIKDISSDQAHQVGPFSHDPFTPFLETPTFSVPYILSQPMGLMSPNGSLLTVWALERGNWVWNYSVKDSVSFRNARVWRMLIFPNNFVMIKNIATNTCLNAYGNGVIHYTCDTTNRAQIWELKQMDNQAVQIKNYSQQRCLQAPVDSVDESKKAFAVQLVDCVSSGVKNLDQQWYVIDVIEHAQPIYRIR